MTTVLAVVVSFVAGAACSRHRVAIFRAILPAKRRVVSVSLTIIGCLLLVLVSGFASRAKRPTPVVELSGEHEVLAEEAFYHALKFGSTYEGARAYRDHVRLVFAQAEAVESFDHRLAERGDIEMPSRGASPLPLSDYLVRHPQYRRASVEDDGWHPNLRDSVASYTPSAQALAAFGESG